MHTYIHNTHASIRRAPITVQETFIDVSPSEKAEALLQQLVKVMGELALHLVYSVRTREVYIERAYL